MAPAPDSTSTTSQPGICPSCGAPGSGRFCSSCGAPLEGSRCAACGAALVAGAKFCHRCGRAAGTAASGAPAATEPRGLAGALPWAVAGIALVALVALVAGQRLASNVEAVDPQGMPLPGMRAPGGGPAPDISSLSPREAADRLFDRVMQLDAQRRQDSAGYAAAGGDDRLRFFASMAIQAYQRVTPLDADARYDMGQVALVGGATPLAQAQADTILRGQPDHLLGIVLATRAARAQGDERRARELERRLLEVEAAERARSLPEYQRHDADIAAAVSTARSRS